ncbi:hypothetical protein [Thermococcus gorgonarius]|uniref:Uncharacterized protein n=1 Tax=Thermococcus gorgonarius TaxID=71997 RepID=A0A2Z2M4X8_THEGO|nr:hypothetical protein [Thermococcus gorgonarius]ASJ01130.1 hypothetical protein A3K92_06360 [Thermococcus gorgonarius]
MNWRKTAFGVFLIVMVLNLQLIAAPQAMAMSTNNSSITFRRAVVAWYDEKGKLQMNVTWINKVVNFTNLTNGCPLHESNVTPKVNVSVVTLYNITEENDQLLFFRLNFYNSTFNYTMYALVYRAERSQYNFTLITRILTDKKGGYWLFVNDMNIAPKDENRILPVGDVIVVKNNLTLSEYYWTLNKVLMELRKHDETKWIWDRSAYELRHLSHLVKLKLPEYNIYKTVGISITMDDSVTACVFPLNSLISIKFICTQPEAPSWVIAGACCASLYAIVIGCASACVLSGGAACIACIAGGVFASWASLSGCYGYCPSMQVCVYVLWFKVTCGTLW